MATIGLAGIVEEVVLLHHRTVVSLQGIQLITVGIGSGRQRSTHDFPSVAIQQHEHGRNVGTLDVEGTVAHVKGLEPVLQLLYHLLLVAVRLIVVSVPAGGIGVDLVAVPVWLSSQEFAPLGIRDYECRCFLAEIVFVSSIFLHVDSQHFFLHHVIGLPVLFERGDAAAFVFSVIFSIAITVQVCSDSVGGHQSVAALRTQYHVLSRIFRSNRGQISSCYDVFGVRIIVLLEMYGVGLQIGVMAYIIIGDGASGTYRHVIGVVGIACRISEVPHPARTGIGTTIHLFLVHRSAVDIHVAITVGIGIDSLNQFRRQSIITILQMITGGIGIEELQHIGMTVVIERHEVVLHISDVDVEIPGFGNFNVIVCTLADFTIIVTIRRQFLGLIIQVSYVSCCHLIRPCISPIRTIITTRFCICGIQPTQVAQFGSRICRSVFIRIL